MASKRKSTVPCMIPSKSKHVREEIILGSLPELLPTIPEDSILSISGKESGHYSHSSSKSEGNSEIQRGGTYSCSSCRLESRDLNYFLDHMHNYHIDFRAQPTFYCLDCRVSVVRFEALALHNANAHPKIMEGLVTASLTVNTRDRVTTVEQSLFADNGDDCRESGISLTKTPIAKMNKGKGEPKKFVVSHTVEVRKIDTGKDVNPNMLTHVPELLNGALSVPGAPAMPRNTVTHVITTVSNQMFHQHTPYFSSHPFSNSNKDLPKVMIPLSSIPTYDAAMDTSSFLKTSFGKFPYPTKAELCYLTVVSEFPEEQIKLWFTAQRLKQGISWSPEEIEEARRKMFNTVFQGGTPQKQPAAQQHISPIITHHTVTAPPGSKGPNFQIAKAPFGSMKSRPIGMMGTHPSLSTNPHVTRVSYSTSAIPARLPTVVRTTQVLNQNNQPTLETDKSNGIGLDLAANSGFVSSTSSSQSNSSSSSSSSISSYSSSINSGENLVQNSILMNSVNSITTCSASISNNDGDSVADMNGKPHVKSKSLPIRLERSNSSESHVIFNNTSNSSSTCNNHGSGSPLKQSNTKKHDEENNNKNHHVHKLNNNNNSSSSSRSRSSCEFPSNTCNDNVSNLNHASKAPTESASTTVITPNTSSAAEEGVCKDFPIKGMSILKQLIKEGESVVVERPCPELKVDPIKFNFKRLKMNESDNAIEGQPQEHKPETAEVSAPQLSFLPLWGNKTPQQLHMLRQVFSNIRWPSSQQYEDLSVQTGLPKSEVVRWFSDSRYSHKNGQLKWLETYQRPPTEVEEARGHGENEGGSLREPQAANNKLVEMDIRKHLEGDAGLNSGQQIVWQDSYSPLLSLMGNGGNGEPGQAKESVQPKVLEDPWSGRANDLRQSAANQPHLEQQTDANQTRDGLRMELLEV
ncbi:zinc fingers and homeoboxes protein 3 [Cynoglossus semilaevis]|uniref:zinc fingers and homeoboxes protein 3 n=1 Tax=Cynoglossus semilaevis TaxID=244447 RepID=UPI000D63162E|nr:zinc fingers and homeoboxes protein 3-like [Cynoglossus semilaevis]